MRRLSTLLFALGIAVVFAPRADATPVTAAAASLAQIASDDSVVLARHHSKHWRHYGWWRGHRYGWRHYGWRHRYWRRYAWYRW